MDDSFVKAPVNVPKLSGFDKSHQNLLTTKVGTITPILVDELIPGSKVNLRLALSASLPPLASETFMRCSVKCEAFFVPMRLLCQSFESFFTDNPKRMMIGGAATDVKGVCPVIMLPSSTQSLPSWAAPFAAVGGLPDYLGFKAQAWNHLVNKRISAMPFLAYHRIWQDWYRNSLVQREAFLCPAPTANEGQVPGGSLYGAAVSPYRFYAGQGGSFIWDNANSMNCADGVSLLSLRQRNFGLDYFTTATPEPQQGNPEVVSFTVDSQTLAGQFSIATLRAVNSMQQFKERNNLLGNLYVEQLYGRYGVRPSDGIAQRALYLGRGEFEVYSKGVYQTGESSTNEQGTSNPFKSVGARFGSAYASGDKFIVDDFMATEPGYLFVNATLVPRVTYSSGIDKYLSHYCVDGSITDMANPILQNVGPQPIRRSELTGDTGAADGVFGYTDRYAEFKTKQDQLHGLLRDGQSLQSFALQRSFAPGSGVQISSSFLEIPTNYLDQVAAVNGDISAYGCWMDCFFDYKVAMPLAKYSLPSLQDPAYEHGKTIVVHKGGSKL